MPWDMEHPYMYLQFALSFRISDIDTSGGTTRYYGYVDKSGRWLIIKEDTTEISYRYASGTEDYPTNWGNRTGLTYKYYYDVH